MKRWRGGEMERHEPAGGRSCLTVEMESLTLKESFLIQIMKMDLAGLFSL